MECPRLGRRRLSQLYRKDPIKADSNFKVKVISNQNDSDLLNKYYSNPRKYAKALHFSRIDTSLQEMKEAKAASEMRQCDLIILERSLHGNKVAFDLDARTGIVDTAYQPLYEERFNSALQEAGHPNYYFLLSDFNLTHIEKRAEATQMDLKQFDSSYFTQYILAQTRVFETIHPQSPIIHHFVLDVASNILYLNETIKKLQSLAKTCYAKET